MGHFNLNLNSNESIYEYFFSQDFLDKKYKIRLIKLDDSLDICSKDMIDQNNNQVKIWQYFCLV